MSRRKLRAGEKWRKQAGGARIWFVETAPYIPGWRSYHDGRIRVELTERELRFKLQRLWTRIPWIPTAWTFYYQPATGRLWALDPPRCAL